MEYTVLFVLVIFIVLWGISIYLMRTGKLSAQDWYAKSLGLPQGSIRALVALLLVSSIAFSAVTGTIIPDLPDWLVGILGTVIGFYFGAAMVPRAPKA